MAKSVLVAFNFQRSGLVEPRSLTTSNVRYVRCIWPALARPTQLFGAGVTGIEVQGPPTPRNVIFPSDTVFLNTVVNDAKVGEPARWRETDVPTKSDCFFTRHENRVEDLTPEQARKIAKCG